MSRQGDLFGGPEQEELQAGTTPEAVEQAADGGREPGGPADGGGGAVPPDFSPMATGELGDSLPLGRYAALQYLQYAISTVKDRALPRVGDGQKPVQARILYAMWEMGGRPGTPRKKSARVVGDVLGKFHPHGDASVYDALVRIAQDFTLRYPLVDGEGNFGSRDGDEPAAMRYTEARLTRFAEVLLAELDQGTVDFLPNYDGSLTEPQILPARLPVVLLNGASGIAVGMATEIPSHNLREVAAAACALVRDPDLPLERILELIPGPDFPGGAQIISTAQDIRDAYAGGRGSVRVRSRWSVERLARGQWQVVVHEMPPGVSARRVLEEIEALTSPQPRPGKKSLSPEQQRDKQLLLGLLDRARDESDRNHPIRLVLEPKSARVDEEEFLRTLLGKTSLESNVAVNLVMVGNDGRPASKNLRQILVEWVSFRLETVRRRSRHRLGQVNARIHVLEGRLVVLLNVDEVIRIIRNADDPKADLMERFALSELQADDILDIRLRQLARLEHIRIEKELGELRKQRAALEKMLDDRSTLEAKVLAEIEEDARVHGDARRTLIEAAQRTATVVATVDEPVTVIFSRKGWLRLRQGWGVDPATLNFKEGDALRSLVACRTVDPLVFLDSLGRAYSIRAGDLPAARGDGVPVSSLVELAPAAVVLHLLTGRPEDDVLIATSGGYGFRTKLADMTSNRRAGREFLTLEPGEEPLAPLIFRESAQNYVACLSGQGRLLLFQPWELRQLPKGRGVILMGLEAEEKLLSCLISDQPRITVLGTGRGGKDRALVLSGAELGRYAGRRARMGKALAEKIQATGLRAEPPPAPPTAG